jgi:DNA segregation ATPase FtsK/SpoIIIE-like protein
MNITNSDFFTFNVHNTMFLTGETGSGKSVLQDKLIVKMVAAHSPDTLQFVLLDMTAVDFSFLKDEHPEYIQRNIEIKSDDGLDMLDELAELSEKRVSEAITKPLIFLCIEECDMAASDQKRFDAALMKINHNAKQANLKVIYSTSRPSADVISKQLLNSFDLIVAGKLASKADNKYLGVPSVIYDFPPYGFAVIENVQD